MTDSTNARADIADLKTLISQRPIALTGYGPARDRALSHAAGFDAHLLKPLDPSTLEAAIQQLG